MIKMRVKFTKMGAMRFIGHLDTQRYFQKALRRSGIPIAYTQGFHPHPVISFAQPLGVGLTSSGEYFDIGLEETMDPTAFVSLLDAKMAEGFHVTGARILPEKAKKAMALVAAAEYTVTPVWVENPPGRDALAEAVRRHYTENSQILITKKTKKSQREVDLKPLVYRVTVDEKGRFVIFLSAGSENNIKPELFLSWLLAQEGFSPEDYRLRIHRNDLYGRSKEGFASLMKKD